MTDVLIKNVTHVYGGAVEALRDITIDFKTGELSVLLGPSGCGKTTLLRIIAGLIRPTSGDVYFNGKMVTELPPEKRNIGMVFQFPVVYNFMSVYENLALPLRAKKLSEEEIKHRIREIIELLEIKVPLDRMAGKLGRDEKQLIAIGRAIIKDPNLLLLDEPLTNVDPTFRIILRRKIIEYKIKNKKTIIYVTHDQSEACSMGDKIAVMKDGVILQYGTLTELYNHPKNTFIGYFLGSPGMNFIECDVTLYGNNIIVEFGNTRLKFPVNISQITSHEIIKELERGKIIIGFRPENVEVLSEPLEDAIQLMCEHVERIGNVIVASLTMDGIRAKIRVPLAYAPLLKEGEKVLIRIPYEKMRLFDINGNAVV